MTNAEDNARATLARYAASRAADSMERTRGAIAAACRNVAIYNAAAADGFGSSFDGLDLVESTLGRLTDAEMTRYDELVAVAEDHMKRLAKNAGIWFYFDGETIGAAA